MKRTRSMVYKETEEARELALCTEYESRFILPVIEMLKKHYRRGKYDADKAVDAYYMATCKESKQYGKDYGYEFSVQDRFSAAVMLERDLKYWVEED